ncbi:hypothetical protein [Macrococcoides canis]|uniref:hypothetical protein n=1 Tax=Macrococcoides canis TaxID=1855823 RepID=UPI0022B88906|nr:hypothetical protein [Macrococcus canis]WBF54031.1 hypothetical protein LL975_12065 [Macrococcus canis]
MTKISLKNLRKEIPEEMIPGNFIRGKEILFTYLIVSEVEGEYYVYTYEKGQGYTHKSCTPPFETLKDALVEYQMKELHLKGW